MLNIIFWTVICLLIVAALASLGLCVMWTWAIAVPYEDGDEE